MSMAFFYFLLFYFKATTSTNQLAFVRAKCSADCQNQTMAQQKDPLQLCGGDRMTLLVAWTAETLTTNYISFMCFSFLSIEMIGHLSRARQILFP